MFYRTLITSFFITASFAFSLTAPAQASDIEGQIVGADGRPLQGAEVRIERKDKPSAPLMAKTNAKGNYSANGLGLGIYKISVIESGAVKSAVTMQSSGDSVRIDFDLKPTAGKKVKHYVLVSGTGTHLGARWVEIDENGTPVAGPLNVQRASGELARDMNRRSTGIRP